MIDHYRPFNSSTNRIRWTTVTLPTGWGVPNIGEINEFVTDAWSFELAWSPQRIVFYFKSPEDAVVFQLRKA